MGVIAQGVVGQWKINFGVEQTPASWRSHLLSSRVSAWVLRLVASSPPLVAAHADESSALTAEQLVEIPFEQLVTLEVSSASRYPQKIGEAPSAAVVVDANEIRAHGHRTLADILRGMPGLYVSNDHSWSYLGVRGFSRPGDYNTRVLLLVDGYRVNDNIYNQAYVGNEFLIDVDMIARVEFIPGPGASAYGDNAFFGVINVVPNRPLRCQVQR